MGDRASQVATVLVLAVIAVVAVFAITVAQHRPGGLDGCTCSQPEPADGTS